MPRRGLDVTPRYALLVIGDGRDALRTATLESWESNVTGGRIVTAVEVDDRAHQLGFCGAIREGWKRLRAVHEAQPFDYVFHLEEDWRFTRPVSIEAMTALMDADDMIAQVALKRGTENALEEAAGGLVQVWPEEYAAGVFWMEDGAPHPYLEHRLFFTTNPCMYPYDLIQRFGWPDPPGCEEAFGLTLKAEGYSFAFLGTMDDAPWVEHTGKGARGGRGY